MTSKNWQFVGMVLFLTGAAVGAGLFSLPRIFAASFWLATAALLISVFAVTAVHSLFLRALESRPKNDKHHLPGLLGERYGKMAESVGSLLVMGGLLLSLCAQMLLSSNILADIVGLHFEWAVFAVLILFCVPLFLPPEKFVGLERYTAAGLVVLLLTLAVKTPRLPFVVSVDIPWAVLLGAILFACSSWTSIPSFVHMGSNSTSRSRAIQLAGVFVAVLYFLFGSLLSRTTAGMSADFFAATGTWPILLTRLAGIAAFVAIFLSFGHLSRELRATMRRDFHIDGLTAAGVALLAPYVAILFGARSFLVLAAFAGGVFVSGQYLAILAVSLSAPASRPLKAAAIFGGLLFVVAIVGQLGYLF
jgi:hypothetical protein